jgi:hypothetical protein
MAKDDIKIEHYQASRGLKVSGEPLQVVPGFNFVGPGGTAGIPGSKGGFSTGGYRDNNSSPSNHVEKANPNVEGPRGPKGNKGGTRRA